MAAAPHTHTDMAAGPAELAPGIPAAIPAESAVAARNILSEAADPQEDMAELRRDPAKVEGTAAAARRSRPVDLLGGAVCRSLSAFRGTLLRWKPRGFRLRGPFRGFG